MPTLQALREQRAFKVDAIKAIHAKATTENRDLTDAEQSAFDAGRTEIDKIEKEVRNAEFLATVERHAEADPVSGARDMGELERRFSIGKALGEFAETGRLTGIEGEYAAEHRSGRPNAFSAPVSLFLGETRAVLTTTPVAGPGGNLVSRTLGPLIDLKRPTLAVQAAGATVLSGLTGNLDLPRLTGSGTAYWVPEHTDVTVSDPTFDKISLGPHTVGALYEISRRMLLQSTQIEAILRTDIGFILRQALDSAALVGGGANQPVGLLATAGVPVLPVATNGGPLTTDIPATMVGMVQGANTDGTPTFLTNTKVKAAALKLKDAGNNPLGLPVVFGGEPVIYSNQVPNNLTKGTGNGLSALIYGVWADLILAYWSNVDIVLNPYADSVAKKGGAYLHAFLDADVGIRHLDSFVICKDIAA